MREYVCGTSVRFKCICKPSMYYGNVNYFYVLYKSIVTKKVHPSRDHQYFH